MDKSKKDIYFKGIPLVAFKDKRLTRNAKMIYYEMYYYVSTTDKKITPEFLSYLGKESRTSFYRGWTELKQLGYVKRYSKFFQTHNNTDYCLWEYDIFDEPDTTIPYETCIYKKDL